MYHDTSPLSINFASLWRLESSMGLFMRTKWIPLWSRRVEVSIELDEFFLV